MLSFYLIEEPRHECLTRWHQSLLDVLQDHPRRTLDPSSTHLFFAGFETAAETNWPHYGDPEHAFLAGDHMYFAGRIAEKVVAMPHLSDQNRHVIFDMNPFSGYPKTFGGFGNIVMCGCSLHSDTYRLGRDVAFPASPIISFNRTHVADNRDSILCGFRGAASCDLRVKLGQLDNGGDVIIQLVDQAKYSGAVSPQTPSDAPQVQGFVQLLLRSRFGLVPRGDALFSYRLLETMAAGAVPVVVSDGWVLPFSEILDYSQFAVLVAERDWAEIPQILRAIPDDEALAMRRQALAVYHEHFATLRRQIDTTFDIFDIYSQYW